MAFTFTMDKTTVEGAELVVRGSYTNTGGSTGGEVVTHLSVVNEFTIRPTGAAILASVPVTNETYPLQNATGSVTMINNANEVGRWEAKGY